MYPEQYAITVQCTVILYRTVYTKQYIYTRDGNTGQYIKLIQPLPWNINETDVHESIHRFKKKW